MGLPASRPGLIRWKHSLILALFREIIIVSWSEWASESGVPAQASSMTKQNFLAEVRRLPLQRGQCTSSGWQMGWLQIQPALCSFPADSSTITITTTTTSSLLHHHQSLARWVHYPKNHLILLPPATVACCLRSNYTHPWKHKPSLLPIVAASKLGATLHQRGESRLFASLAFVIPPTLFHHVDNCPRDAAGRSAK